MMYVEENTLLFLTANTKLSDNVQRLGEVKPKINKNINQKVVALLRQTFVNRIPRMKAQELRIGNKLLFLGDVVTFKNITEIREDGIFWIKTFEPKIESKNFHFKPIPITEEWLLKFGFIKSDLDGDNAWLNLKYRFLNFSSDESVNFEKVYLTVNKMDIICSYVHELQNLYFALTQTELHAN